MSETGVPNKDIDEKSRKKKYVCTFEGCSSAFGKPDRLQQHIRVHTGERPFKCERCDCSYTRNFHLKRHISTAHENIAPLSFLCPVEGCGKQLTSLQRLNAHHKRFHAGNYLKCPSCDKTFLKNQQLKIHQYQHTGVLPFVCEFPGCEKRFLMPSKLKAHSKVHQGYTCDVQECNQYFPNWTELRKHKSQAHSKVFSCGVCDKVFNRSSLLNSHEKQHQSEREVFHCPIDDCQRWCYYKNNLEKHIETFHTPGKFNCREEGCNKVYRWKASLKNHMKTHRASSPKVVTERKERVKRNSKPRKDKGKPKKAIAAILSGHPITYEENHNIMRSLE